MKKTQKLLVNTIVLTAATFLMRTIEVSFNVYLTNKIGSAGIGLFQLVMTVYALSVTFASSGVRLASTRLTVDAVDVGKFRLKDIMNNCFGFALFMGITISFLLFAFADIISTKWLGDIMTARPLKILAIALPFIAVSSALNGYYTASRKASVFAVIQMAEQGVKIAIIVVLLKILLPKGVEYACISIVIGITVSEVIAALFSYTLYRMMRPSEKEKGKSEGIFRKMLRIAIPDSVGSSVRSILLTIEHILIPIGFKKSGASQTEALSIYGKVHGMVFPLLLYPSSVLGSLSGLLVPEIAELDAKGLKRQINSVIEICIKMTMIFSICTAGILYIFASDFSQIIYKTKDCTMYIQILAPLIPVMYLDMMVDGMLKGLDQQLHSMRYNIFDSGICVVLVYFLIPRYSIKGYIAILFISEIINFILSIRRLSKVANLKINLKNSIIKPIVAIIIATLVQLCCGAHIREISKPLLFLKVLLTLSIYIFVLFLTKSTDKKEIKRIKIFFR